MKKSARKIVSIRDTPILRSQIEDLIKKLGENQSRVIVRAIAEAHQKYCEKVKTAA